MATKTFEFEVVGSCAFPIDMLRYDRACPKSESDSAVIEQTFRRGTGPFKVMLVSAVCPTDARWASFGWRVRDVEEVRS